MSSLLRRTWAYALPSVLTLLGAIGTLRPMRDSLPVDSIYWTFLTLLLGVASIITSVISTVSCVILLKKNDTPPTDRRSGMIATALAWASLAVALKIIR